MEWLVLPFNVIKLVLVVLNFPIFYWLVKRFTKSNISFQKKKKRILIQGKDSLSYEETRFFFQNEQDIRLKPVSIRIKMTKGKWYTNQEKKISSVSIIHGPMGNDERDPDTQNEPDYVKPQITFETINGRDDCIINFNEGVRPLATWVVICRSALNEGAVLNSINAQGSSIWPKSYNEKIFGKIRNRIPDSFKLFFYSTI